MDEIFNKHYIRINTDNQIVKGFSDAFEKPHDGDICINEKGGRHLELLGLINPPLQNMQGAYLYKYVKKKVVAKSQKEIEKGTAAPEPPKPTYEERICAIEAAIAEMAGEMYG